MSVKQAYLAELAAKGFQSDPAQLRASTLCSAVPTIGLRTSPTVECPQKLLNRPDIPGVYMYGGVGRGKSF